MHFEIYKDARGEWRWRLEASNYEPISSGESYKNKAACEAAVDLVKSTTRETPVRELETVRGAIEQAVRGLNFARKN